MDIEKWLEWGEVSRSVFEEFSYTKQYVMHVHVPNQPLSSIVLQPFPVSDEEGKRRVMVHPVLFDFLSYSHATVSIQNAPSDSPDDTPCENISLDCLSSNFRHFAQTDPRLVKNSDWSVSMLPLKELPTDSVVLFDVIFCDDTVARHLQKLPVALREPMFKNLLLGRILKQNAVLLLSTDNGYIIGVTMLSAKEPEVIVEANEAFRIPNDPDGFELELGLTEDTLEELAEVQDESEEGKQATEAPGYETALEEIKDLVNLGRTNVAPTAVLLTGCPGVGKSRLSSVLASSFSPKTNSEGRVVSLLSADDIFVHAVTETNLFENYISPTLRGCNIWILDNLQLLERENSDEPPQQDAEYTSVLNSIVHAIDVYQESCFILGITRDSARLPHALTKVGRFEKEIEMLPPSQTQREMIWGSILGDTVPQREIRENWGGALADVTAGCVASDLVRIHEDAVASFIARQSESNKQGESLSWEFLREAAKNAVPSQLEELDVRKPRIFEPGLTWKEIHELSWESFCGYESSKQAIYRQVVLPWRQFLLKLETSEDVDALQIPPPPGVLFHGPSGCGKTFAVPFLASSLQLSTIQVRATDVLDKWLGGSEALVRALFARARASSPCVLFIDEIDAIATNRETDSSNDFTSRILSTFLNEMDGVSSGAQKNKVLVVACTNRLEALDAALLRPGRLQEHFALKSPTEHDLLEILRYYLRKVPLQDDVRMHEIAQRIFEKGLGAAHVEGFCRDACLEAFRRTNSSNDVALQWDDFLIVLERSQETATWIGATS